MSVFNSAPNLAQTLDSVLRQADVDLEFIVVNDGSTDGSTELLNDYAAADSRLRILHQGNAGLTQALIRGCAAARGEYIARQDAGGDISLEGRMARQCQFLNANPDVVMVSCGTRFMGPEDEELYTIVQNDDDLQNGLGRLNIKQIRGPSHHGSTMFRSAVYRSVGGYRALFRVAQDLDLWLRMADGGRCVAIPQILYQARLTRGSISQVLRSQQIKTTHTILRCAALRRSGDDETSALMEFKHDFKRKRSWLLAPRPLQDARFYYFIGSVLRKNEPLLAKKYFCRALDSWFVYPKALVSLLLLMGRT
ncbi:MAG: glycosyltransferase [Gammaproteobacteria bacterium]|nr:glycosyltransferase [Gammaproteobacteria bacterium]